MEINNLEKSNESIRDNVLKTQIVPEDVKLHSDMAIDQIKYDLIRAQSQIEVLEDVSNCIPSEVKEFSTSDIYAKLCNEEIVTDETIALFTKMVEEEKRKLLYQKKLLKFSNQVKNQLKQMLTLKKPMDLREQKEMSNRFFKIMTEELQEYIEDRFPDQTPEDPSPGGLMTSILSNLFDKFNADRKNPYVQFDLEDKKRKKMIDVLIQFGVASLHKSDPSFVKFNDFTI